MNKPVLMSEKVELTALQLVYLVDFAIKRAIELKEQDLAFNTLVEAQIIAVNYVETHRKETEQ